MKDRKTTPAISEDECQELLKRSKRVSSAPHPISPLDPKLPILGGSCVAPPEPGPANWKYWRNIESIELWQGLLLSLNIEPTGGGVFIQNMPDEMALIGHRNGGGFIPYEYMDSKGITTEFLSRWHMIRNKLETAYAASGICPSVDLANVIRLPVFAMLAVQFEWAPLPCELATIASSCCTHAGLPELATLPDTKRESQGTREKPHIKYLAALHAEYPAATARELRRLCIAHAKAVGEGDSGPEFPFWIRNNDLALKGTTRAIGEGTFSNWFSDAKKLG